MCQVNEAYQNLMLQPIDDSPANSNLSYMIIIVQVMNFNFSNGGHYQIVFCLLLHWKMQHFAALKKFPLKRVSALNVELPGAVTR